MKNFHIFQADAFIDYSSKFKIKDVEELLFFFGSWAKSKMLCEKDKKIILELVKEDYIGKSKKTESKKTESFVTKKSKNFERNNRKELVWF